MTVADSSQPGSPEPRWLTGPEQEAWLPLAILMSKIPVALDKQLQTDAGISHFEYTVLTQLSSRPNRTLRMSALAELTGGSLSRLSHLVKRMERHGWMRREPCPDDGRYTNAILTDEGLAKVASAAPGHVEAVRNLVLDALSPADLRHLRDLGHRILNHMDSDALWPPPDHSPG
ncbi:MarR family winged helix-turn-helix transcriptional regulator [Lentzea sp. BCCO 10_0798]|uniref:MarR family winged helix-turn-helix transcriptional regulator n=1 Tax=Lentzea kristufekii TaxID=3095430 RepID=A0ABU4TJU8_9PSEU|nr:MarR family winged helix-turn-helix transcriptional regulator [Lentzea sp. BCCO 10_0798]MDX8048547.1 MarR family winged helix-turn-helix transcriptional regulator [Lentzea sp. BCCO 10_0798]